MAAERPVIVTDSILQTKADFAIAAISVELETSNTHGSVCEIFEHFPPGYFFKQNFDALWLPREKEGNVAP